MIRGIYTTVAGMNLQVLRIDTTSNNLANIGVPGFKKDRVLASSFPQLLQLSSGTPDPVTGMTSRKVLGETNQGVVVQQVLTDFSQGTLRETGNAGDFALKGEGYFTLSDPNNEGNLFYSRSGSFKLNKEGYLTNDLGYRVMSDGGPIQIKSLEQITIDENGSLMEDGDNIGRFSIVTFENTSALARVGNNLFITNDQEPVIDENPGLVHRFVESANVDAVEETVNMVSAARAYETGQKIIQAQDSMLGMAINKVGVVR